jgi:lipoyl(octanoyl) transferase
LAEKRPCITWSAPRVAYREAWDLQHQRVLKIAAGEAPATIFLLEHHPVVTIGRGGHDEHLLLPEAVLREKGVDCVRIDRGGDVTFHGPGQLVVYPMLPLGGADRDVHRFLRRIEAVGIRVLEDFGLTGKRVPGYTGVWVDDVKIMAIGVAMRKWVTFHGLAFNFATNLEGFGWIVPCGIKGKGVTSLHLLLRRMVTREEVEAKFKTHLAAEFGLQLSPPVNPLEKADA